MTIEMDKLTRLSMLIPGLFLLTSCVGGGAIPEDHYYRLPVIKEFKNNSTLNLKGEITINSVMASGILNERSILYVENNKSNEVNLYYYRHWIDAPAKMIRQHLETYLESNHFMNTDSTSNENTSVSITLLNFERVMDKNDANARVVLRISHTNNKKREFSKTYEANVKANGREIYHTVDAFGIALEEIYSNWLKDME